MDHEKIESLFFKVLDDMQDYLPDLTLVGGWIPYIYSNFLWKTPIKNPVTTVDIDFGVDHSLKKNYLKTVYETLSSLDYKEHHAKMGKMFPVVLYKGSIPVEFITYPAVDIGVIEKILGKQIQVSKVDKFDFLLKHRIPIRVQTGKKSKYHTIYCPSAPAFLYHKGATFRDRENTEKVAKDLYYMYFILRYAPDVNLILKEIPQYAEEGCFSNVSDDINKFFERVSSQGCLLVEKENGPDEYIKDLRQDIFDRFRNFREALAKI